ncbi:MAG TPA: ABC transporter substrate-binding protein, partial [Burkholderiales bacterium]|nr:ABC transporter substrate-binding protein [Burkholderiales bacterium]
MLLAIMAGAAFAADLVIGRATEQSSLDPLFARSGTNYSTSGQIFERLVMNDANNQLHPALAVSWRALDRLTVQLKTSQPVPSLIEQVGRAFILSKKAATGLATADFNAGKGMVGTGPYKFVEWRPAQYLKLVRYAAYWGPRPDFENVTLKYISKDAGRIAALLSGDVDLIDEVSPDGARQLKTDARTRVYSIGSTR